MKSVAFATLGCKSNYTDTEEMIASCRAAGLRIVSFDDEADAYVVNTCTVTATADRQSCQMIRRPMRARPGAVVVAVGCAVEVDRDSVRGIGADAIFGTKERGVALEFIFEKLGVKGRAGDRVLPANTGPQSRARAFLKIEDGCDRRCAYCIVPRARGAAVSFSPDEIERDCLLLAQAHREIVLTGIDIGQYMFSSPDGRKTDLLTLLERLVSIPGMPRLRISSLDPSLIDERLIDLIASSGKICRHVHLSIQSASERVIHLMGRSYSPADIEAAVSSLVSKIGGVAVTGDVIAGFPGEDIEDHDFTVKLLAKLPIAGLHVFPYSPRENTRAASMPGHLPLSTRQARARELRSLGFEKRRGFLLGQKGKRSSAIVISPLPDATGRVQAFSDNAMSISMPAGEISYGEIGSAMITDVSEHRVWGTWD